ncbi:MAG: MBL fold metallo-hydrolase [Dehalococcoidia bacterium]|uniref:MBL fold metallo-hydrolase n=1 Tax=Candidatus Amarobacter glycogenicus TaxID=3140699 RepID=UPI00313600E1|nr:MBL fold metallo-hydrolase [Dehalococcoidia bacterium]
MEIRLDWLGCATFRLTLGETVVFLDAYMDRVPTAPKVGLSAKDVRRADFVLVGHAHFDHIAGAELIARNTGARIIGSHESCRVMREQDVAANQLLPSQGGERHRLAADVTVRVFPSLHSCTWTTGSLSAMEASTGDLGLCEDERAGVAARQGLGSTIGRRAETGDSAANDLRAHLATAIGSGQTGGPLAYLIETPQGSIFWQDTSGCWTGVLRELRPDVAILAAAGRGNLDGEPIQGSLADFIRIEAELLQPRTIVLGHHDNWMPPVTPEGGTDVSPIRTALAGSLPAAKLLEPGYMEGTLLLG